jgi:protein-tyrosine phosphatase
MTPGFVLDTYGSRRGMVLACAHTALYFAGAYRQHRAIDWGAVRRLVFVCRGNICRSPFAEIVARAHGLEAASCGLDTRDGKEAHPKAIAAAQRKGYDLSLHRATRIESIARKADDLFVLMEPSQIALGKRKLGAEHAYTLAGVWGTPPKPYIHDPYSAGDGYFDTCFDYLEGAILAMKRELASQGRGSAKSEAGA